MEKTIYFISALILILLLAAPAFGAEKIAPELDLALSLAGPDDELPVIITLTQRARLNRALNETRSERRVRWVKKLREVADATQPALASLLQSHQARNLKSLWLINGMSARIPARAIPFLAMLPAVKRIQLDFPIPLAEPAPITTMAAPEWNISLVKAPDLWALGFRGQGVVVATVDTGVDPLHPDLAGRWRGGTNSWYDPNNQHLTPHDSDGHGTWVTGLMVGGDAGGSSIGMAPDAQWIAAKIFDDNGDAWTSAIHLAFQWILDPDHNPETDDAPDIVNNSWGYNTLAGSCYSEFTEDIAALREAGIAVVFAAGNTGPADNTSISPANNTGALAVGSVNRYSVVSSFSAAGPSACDGRIFPDLVAPGESVRSSGLTSGGANLNSYAIVSGTSFSSPTVAGGIALLISAFPGADLTDLETVLLDSGYDLGPQGPDNDYGHGLMDVLAAYELLADIIQPLLPPPAAPSNLVISVTPEGTYARFRSSWTDNSNEETGFTMQSALDANFTQGVTTYTYAANRISGNQLRTPSSIVLYYRLQSFNANGTSAWVNATPFPASLPAQPPAVPAAPSNFVLTATVVSGTLDRFRGSWTDNSNNETGFTMQRASDPNFTTNIVTYAFPINRTTSNQLLPRGADYYYRLRADGSVGSSAWVNAAPFPIAAP